MVCHRNLILDSGKLKYCPEAKEMDILREVELKNRKILRKSTWDENLNDYKISEERNVGYKPIEGKLKWWFDKWESEDYKVMYANNYNKTRLKSWEGFLKSEKEIIYGYLGRIPFNPCVMINISPDWKGQKIDSLMTKHFTKVIDKYLNEGNRYSKWKYVLECGSEGDFLHAHIVAEINPDLSKSVMTHINKGNHAVQLRKAWDNLNGGYSKGKLKGKYSIQRVILRTETLRDDKLEYLVEDLKPEGHKNKKNLGLTFGGF